MDEAIISKISLEEYGGYWDQGTHCRVEIKFMEGEGYISFRGTHSIWKLYGTLQGELTTVDVERLQEAFEHIQFFELESDYRSKKTDSSGIYVEVKKEDGAVKSVQGDLDQMPIGLWLLIRSIEALVLQERWKKG